MTLMVDEKGERRGGRQKGAGGAVGGEGGEKRKTKGVVGDCVEFKGLLAYL